VFSPVKMLCESGFDEMPNLLILLVIGFVCRSFDDLIDGHYTEPAANRAKSVGDS
jgi:hypothetical protein